MKYLLPLAVLMLVTLNPSWAATYRYSTSNNRIYAEGGGSATLSAIKAALPSAPLDLVDATNRIWLLRANLYVAQGTKLMLNGSAASGDVNELRLKSDSGGFVELMADHGTLDIRSTRIRSWDASARGPDANYSDGRAFVRVRSRLASDGVSALESRMDVINSEMSYLGYNASETQGVVWKVLGSPSEVPDLYDRVQVRGDIRNSNLHHNYYGMYSYGHEGGQWTGNTVAYNVGYGFDPHDDSDNLLIEDNDVHHNGNHGIIASKRCDHVVIRNNRSWDNTGNGIMLHRSSNDGLIENNDLRRNSDSGVAIFASDRATIRGNYVEDSGKAGMRFSMGAIDSYVEDNEIVRSGTYGFYFYKGSDTPEPGENGRNSGNVFVGNTVRDGAADGLKLSDSDDDRFIENIFSNNGSDLRVIKARNIELIGNTIPDDVRLRLAGTSSLRTTVSIEEQKTLLLAVDAYSTASFIDRVQAVFDVSESVASIADSTRSTMTLTQANIGGDTKVYLRNMRAGPSTGTVEIKITSWRTSGTRNKTWAARTTNGSASVNYSVGDLIAGTRYVVQQGTRTVGLFTADSNGRVAFTDAPASTAQLSYTLAPG
jgi:poly(beta-D-mannuronate) C5 epimerase